MWEKFFLYIMENHRGKALGLLLGLVAGILIISYGVLKALFIIMCVLIGFLIGKSLDENPDFNNWFDRFRGR